jgi:hypothetical protein
MTMKRPERWKANPAIKVYGDGTRSTTVGDVIVDPTCGAWLVEWDGYTSVTPPGPVRERMEKEGIVPGHFKALGDWLEDMKSAVRAHEREEPGEKALVHEGRDR